MQGNTMTCQVKRMQWLDFKMTTTLSKRKHQMIGSNSWCTLCQDSNRNKIKELSPQWRQHWGEHTLDWKVSNSWFWTALLACMDKAKEIQLVKRKEIWPSWCASNTFFVNHTIEKTSQIFPINWRKYEWRWFLGELKAITQDFCEWTPDTLFLPSDRI